MTQNSNTTQKPMTNKCKCGHDKDNHYLGTEGCAICDKYLCTKFEPVKEKLLWDACGGIPGCNHPQGQQCDCPCHIPDVTKKDETWNESMGNYIIETHDQIEVVANTVLNLFQKRLDSEISKAVEEASRRERLEVYKDILKKQKEYPLHMPDFEFWLNETINQMEKH